MDNDLYYLCGLIEYLSRRTHNFPREIVRCLGKTQLRRIYECAEAYHCDILSEVAQELVEEYNIPNGQNFNDITCEGRCPTYWEIGRVYARLIQTLSDEEQRDIIDVLLEVYNSFLSPLIENFNLDIFYQSPQYHLASYRQGEPLEA